MNHDFLLGSPHRLFFVKYKGAGFERQLENFQLVTSCCDGDGATLDGRWTDRTCILHAVVAVIMQSKRREGRQRLAMMMPRKGRPL